MLGSDGDLSRSGLLLGFGRLISSAQEPGEILSALVAAVADKRGVAAHAAAVLQLGEDGCLRVVACHGLGPAMNAWVAPANAFEAEVGHDLARAAGLVGHDVRTLLLISGGDLYGLMVLLAGEGAPFSAEQVEVAEGLADMAAVSLDKDQQLSALRRSRDELRASQQVLVHSENLRAIGEMSAGIAHDLKNILNPLVLTVVLLRRRLEKNNVDGALNLLPDLEEALRSGTEVVDRLRVFAKSDDDGREPEPVDLVQIAGMAASLARPRLRDFPQIELVSVPASAPAVVMARKSELLSAVLNLVLNAIEAMGARGEITLSTGPGFIEVADTGPGIPAELQQKVFEPFFTTKRTGTGLGLAMVQNFVRRYGGSLKLESAVGAGTRVRLVFPVGEMPVVT